MRTKLALLASALVAVVLLTPTLINSQAPPGAPRAASPGAGVVLKIVSASIPADLRPVVTFSLTDSSGAPLQLADVEPNELRFLVAALRLDPTTKQTDWMAYTVSIVAGKDYAFGGKPMKPALASATQVVYDIEGAYTTLAPGKYSYKFKTAVPKDFDRDATHAVGGQVTRDRRKWVSNDVHYFVPSGKPAKLEREVVTTKGCNACHDRLAAHGGQRADVRLCALCHTPQTIDPESGNTVDFKVMVAKIHSGHNLPSVKAKTPYYIVGFRQTLFDFSGVRFPQDVRNCQTCHVGAQAASFKTQPSIAACGACHDRTDFKNHQGGPQTNATCRNCHEADGPEFGPGVVGSHTIPERSKQLRGVNFEIVSFTNTKPGESPTVVFSMKDNAGKPIAPKELARLFLTLAGPTTEYTNLALENAASATATPDGNWSYTFKAKIPADAKGTYAVGIEGYFDSQLKNPSGAAIKDDKGKPLIVRDVGYNKVAYGAVTDAKPVPRTQVVDIKNCNVCHERLALHGNIRQSAEYCVLCHTPVMTDVDKRAQAKGPMPPESIHFTRLVHKIHTGEELHDKPYIIYGGPPVSPGPLDMSEARYPTDRRNCVKCHVPNSYLLSNMRKGALPTTVKQGDAVISSIPPIQAACGACHDNEAAKAHIQTQTAAGGRESCVVCHTEGREAAVGKVHAR